VYETSIIMLLSPSHITTLRSLYFRIVCHHLCHLFNSYYLPSIGTEAPLTLSSELIAAPPRRSGTSQISLHRLFTTAHILHRQRCRMRRTTPDPPLVLHPGLPANARLTQLRQLKALKLVTDHGVGIEEEEICWEVTDKETIASKGTALYRVCRAGKIKTTGYLLERGANLNAKDTTEELS
jgi:hypothetical protein